MPAQLLLAVLAALSAGCWPGSGEVSGWVKTPDARDRVRIAAHLVLEDEGLRGLSGLTRDGAGRFWVIPERQDKLLLLPALPREAKKRAPASATLPLHGKPAGLDGEALAWISPGLFAVGTESQQARAADSLLLVRAPLTKAEQAASTKAEVTERIELSYAPWGIKADVNRGIEGLCASAGKVVMVAETVVELEGLRWAPLAVLDLNTRRWSYYRLKLSSDDGKLSSLACRARPGGTQLEVLAIERHYSVSRLLGFTLPLATPPKGAPASPPGLPEALKPTLRVELDALFRVAPNFEGVEWLSEERLLLMVDNDSGGITGPNELYVLELAR